MVVFTILRSASSVERQGRHYKRYRRFTSNLMPSLEGNLGMEHHCGVIHSTSAEEDYLKFYFRIKCFWEIVLFKFAY